MNKFKLLAAIAIVATLATLATSCEKTKTPEQLKLEKKQAIEKEIRKLETEYLESLKPTKENPEPGIIRNLPTKEESEKRKKRNAKLDSLRSSLK